MTADQACGDDIEATALETTMNISPYPEEKW